MKVNLQIYKNLRPYRHLSLFGIINQIFCNRIMTSKLLVSAAPSLYQTACKFPGKTITHFIINSTFCQLFTGGNKLSDLQRYNRHLIQRGIPTIIDFCAEGTRDQLNSQRLLDQNAELFTKSAQQAVLIPNQLISIKITALVNLDLLEKYNRSILLRDKIWRQYSVDGKLSAQSLFDALQKLYQGLGTEDIQIYAKQIHQFQGENISQFSIDQFAFKMNHHPYNLYEPHKNDLLVMKLLFPLDINEKNQIGNMKKRLDQILDKQYNNVNNLRILVDAEQTYVQRAIESISEQLQQKYNKQRSYIIVTLQNYLKKSQARVVYELALAEKKKLNLGIKLVRGAYLVEETKLCQKHGTQSQIVGTFQETTNNYLKNFQKLVTSQLNGEIFAVTHNQQTIRALLDIKSKKSNSIKVNFAQLCGIGDHLTYFLKSKNQNVYKLFPWAEPQVMVGYLIRRAEELSQMNYPLDIQYSLLKSEFYSRTLSI